MPYFAIRSFWLWQTSLSTKVSRSRKLNHITPNRFSMKKGFKTINSFCGAVIILTLLPVLSIADTIVLQEGQSIEVDKVIEHEDDVIFYVQGLKMRVSKTAVLRITKADEAGIAGVEKPFEIAPLPAEKPSARLSEKGSPEIRWSGFRNLCWASACSALGQLQEIESANGTSEIKKYVRANEDLRLGEARLNSIVYAFWRDQLYAVTLWATGQANYRELRKEIFNRFGVGLNSDQSRERYLWSDVYSDRILKYDGVDQSTFFWMRSKEIGLRYQLSQTKIPSTCLKALEKTGVNSN